MKTKNPTGDGLVVRILDVYIYGPSVSPVIFLKILQICFKRTKISKRRHRLYSYS